MLTTLPEQFKDDPELVAALNGGYTVYIGTFDPRAAFVEGRLLLVLDGKPLFTGGDAVKALPRGVDLLYMIIPLSVESYTRGNFHCHVYDSVTAYEVEIHLRMPRGGW